MYVTDSLFFLQHLVGGNENDEERQMFGTKYRELLEEYNNPKPEESAKDIQDRIIAKSKKLAGA